MKKQTLFNTLIIPITLLIIGKGDGRFIAPYPSAPLCPDSRQAHDTGEYHSLWNDAAGCHYDHEHGDDPAGLEVTFPGLHDFLGGVWIGHTNPSSEHENTDKHGGFKWSVDLATDSGCQGVEGAAIGVRAAAVQFHGFGNYAVEFEGRIHSSAAAFIQCAPGGDDGYLYINQHQDYGQRTAPYQGEILPYPDTPQPPYLAGLEPYVTLPCYAGGVIAPKCAKDATLNHLIIRGKGLSVWSSEPDNVAGSTLFNFIFAVNDVYRAINAANGLVYPFDFRWLCTVNAGLSYYQPGCKFNNSTHRVNEVSGIIPAGWDNLAGFDTEPEAGRITAEGYVTRFGALNLACTGAGPDCHPIKMVRAYAGQYGAFLVNTKDSNPDPPIPDYDIYFCSGAPCPAGTPSGWIGQGN